jgi:Tat protein secretion system quality control protein TatD with DNase activity
MLVDSHCHLDFPELAADLPAMLRRMAANGVGAALCAGVTLERFPLAREIASGYDNIYTAVGVHPDTQDGKEPDVETLVELARNERVVAIGETGLDYYRLTGDLAAPAVLRPYRGGPPGWQAAHRSYKSGQGRYAAHPRRGRSGSDRRGVPLLYRGS